ncbi:hypothetical protein FH5_05315 [Priestia endophytica]|nr:hypothetical protein FH5_05315 [Priestia endophytica]
MKQKKQQEHYIPAALFIMEYTFRSLTTFKTPREREVYKEESSFYKL